MAEIFDSQDIISDLFENGEEGLTKEELDIEENELNSLEENITFESTLIKCTKCGFGDVLKTGMTSNLTVYTRQGTKRGLHILKRCNNYRCRAGYQYGYSTLQKIKYYDENVLQNKYLITSSQTAFEVEFLWDITLQIHFSQASMESLASIYNNLHLTNLPFDTLKKREKINRKRITEAYMTYIFIEKSQRFGIKCPRIRDLNSSILDNMTFFKESFRNMTSEHTCEVPGCSKVLVIDGGCKPHR